MRNFLLGAISVILLTWVASYDLMTSQKPSRYSYYFKEYVVSGGYLMLPLSGHCSVKNVTMIDDEVVSEADYFECDWFQRLINKESK